MLAEDKHNKILFEIIIDEKLLPDLALTLLD
jgi:hypothetical protein